MNNEIAIPVPDLASDDHFACERSAKWNKDFKFLLRETRVINLLLRHPDVPWHVKVIAACTLGYPPQSDPGNTHLHSCNWTVGRSGSSPHRDETASRAYTENGAG
jgi:hypothetical protein